MENGLESVLVEILSVEASIRNELESGNVHSPMSQMHGDWRFRGRVGSGVQMYHGRPRVHPSFRTLKASTWAFP